MSNPPMSDRSLRRLAWVASGAWLLLVGVLIVLAVVVPAGAGDPGSAAWAILNAPFSVVAIVILARQPRNRIGWLLMAIGLLAAQPLGAYGALALGSGLPGGAVALILGGSMWVPPIVLIGTVLLLRFPTGRLLSPSWRKVEWLSLLAIGLPLLVLWLTPGDFADLGYPGVRNPLGLEGLRDVLGVALVLLLLVPVAIAISVTSLVVRFRRSRGVEREQLKWLTTAAAVVAGLYLFGMVASVATGAIWGDTEPAWLEFVDTVSGFSFILLPVSTGIAILRYRLYDIDRIISRTLGYATVTAILGSLFVAIVVGLQALALPFTGGSELAIALSTLTVAALSGPVRRRVQNAVDRRFDRARYDSARIAEDFGARVRNRLDLDELSTDLVTTADHALRPATASVWMRTRQ
jgi:hypothetical protein